MTMAVTIDSTIRTEPRPTCPMCGNPGVREHSGVRDRLFGVPGQWSFSRCSNADCRLLWLDPRPLEDDIHYAYTSYYTHTSSNSAKSLTARFVSASLGLLIKSVTRASGLAREREDVSSRHLQGLPPGRLLDIGCGDGKFLHRVKNLGWSVEGLDFDEQAARAAKQQYDIDVRICRLEDMGCPDNSFDAVTMNHVIEHVFDPVATLREICRILKPGGILVSVTPNAESLGQRTYGANWRGLEPPRHIQIFSRQAMAAAARAAGLDLVRVYSTAANAWVFLSASSQIAESAAAGSKISQRPSIMNLLKAIALGYREARMNVGSGNDGEENVLLARKERR